MLIYGIVLKAVNGCSLPPENAYNISVAKPKTILSITIVTEKEIVLSVVKKDVAIKIINAIKEKAGVGTEAHGLCFFMPVEMSTLTIHEKPFDEAEIN